MSKIFVRYGTFAHPPGEVEITITRDVLLTEAETPFAYAWRADLIGTIFGDSQRDLNTKIAGMEAAYRITRQDFQVVLDDGTLSAISLASGQTNGGIRVSRPPSFPAMQNASLVTFVNFQISLEAEEFLTDIETALRSFEETVSRSGGGPRGRPGTGRPLAADAGRATG